MKPRTRLIVYFAAGIAVGVTVVAGVALRKIDPSTTSVDVSPDGRPQYQWHVPAVPSAMDFCGEPVPLDKWEVKEKLGRELLSNAYQHGGQLYIQQLSGRYFPIIEERLKANGVPDDFKYLCVAESALQQNVISPAGAASFWQFMKDTGPRYNLEISDEVDERFNVLKATDAACQYFKDAKTKFGTWTAAAASYNCGQGGFASQAEFQQSNNYYDLIFPDETNRYIYRILALKHLQTHPRAYGMIVEPEEQFKPLKGRIVTVDKTIADLTVFAKENGSSYKMLKIYNPWLRAHKLTVKPGKKYDIMFPNT